MKVSAELEKEATRVLQVWLSERGLTLQRGTLYTTDATGEYHVLTLDRRTG